MCVRRWSYIRRPSARRVDLWVLSTVGNLYAVPAYVDTRDVSVSVGDTLWGCGRLAYPAPDDISHPFEVHKMCIGTYTDALRLKNGPG